jgi:N-hydroxyarylamine O-acetyltransferase
MGDGESSFAAYLRRLGMPARPAPDLPSLAELTARHMQTVPFENLDIVRGVPRRLSTHTALQKVVARARGGFCYELNEAFRALLEHLGFVVRRIEARVWQATAQRFGAPFDHLALVVSLPEGEFLVDVGYGDSNRTPMRLPEDHAADISGEYRLYPVRGEHAVRDVLHPVRNEPPVLDELHPARDEHAVREELHPARDEHAVREELHPARDVPPVPNEYWRLSSKSYPLYEMTLAAQPLEAFEPMCRYHQSSPESVFSKGLICTRATASGRITLSRERLIIVEDGRRTETHCADVPAALELHFGIRDVR